MGVKLTHNVTNDTCGFFIWLVWRHAQFIHPIKDSPLNWFQPISNVWKGPGNDDAHCIIQK